MTDNSNQFTEKTHKLLRGLRRSVPGVPELSSSPPAAQQKRRIKMVAIYGQPIIAHCINQGEFLYPKVIGHKLIKLDDDDANTSPDTTDDDTRKPNGTYGCFSMKDFLFLKNNTAYQRIRIKLSSSALDIRPWRIGHTEAGNGLMVSSESRAWIGCIEATLSVQIAMNVTYDRKIDAFKNAKAQKVSDAAFAMSPARITEPTAATVMPPTRIAEPTAETAMSPAMIAEPTAALALLPARIAEPTAVLALLPARIAEPTAALALLPARIAEPTAAHALLPARITAPTATHALLPARIAEPTAALALLPARITEPTTVLAMLPARIGEPTAALALLPARIAKPTAALTMPQARIAEPTSVLAMLPARITDPTAAHAMLPGRIAEPTAALALLPARIGEPTAALVLLPARSTAPTAAHALLPARIAEHTAALALPPARITEPTAVLALLPARIAEPTAVLAMPQARIAEPTAFVAMLPVRIGEPTAALALLPAKVAEPTAAAAMPGLSRYQDQICWLIRGLRLTVPEVAYNDNQVTKQKGLQKNTIVNLSAIANHITSDTFVHWMAVCQMLNWPTVNDPHLRPNLLPGMHVRNASDTVIVESRSNQPEDVNSMFYTRNHVCKHKPKREDAGSTAVDDGFVDSDQRKDTDPTGHHKKSTENKSLLGETTQTIQGGRGDCVRETQDEYQEKATKPDQIDNIDEEERIIRVEHLWSSDNDEEQNTKLVSATTERVCHTGLRLKKMTTQCAAYSVFMLADKLTCTFEQHHRITCRFYVLALLSKFLLLT